jgi:hypothetical protein
LKGFTPLPAPEYLRKAAAAGNRFETIVKKRLRDDGWTVGDTQAEVEVVVQEEPRIIVRGHLDGGHVKTPGPFEFDWVESTVGMEGPVEVDAAILEVKSMSDRVWREWRRHRFDRFVEYAWQVSTYMHGMRRPAIYVVINRETEDTEIGYMSLPPVPWEEIRPHVLAARWWGLESQELPDCTGAKYPCAYTYLCDRKSGLPTDEVESGSEAVLIRLAEEYAEARNMEREVKAQRAAARSEIVEALGDRSKVEVGVWSISYTETVRRNLDRKALDAYLASNGKRLADFEEESRSMRLTVKGST